MTEINYEKIWDYLKNDMKEAVDDGFKKGYHNPDYKPNDNGRFIAFRYVLDLMNKLDKTDEPDVEFLIQEILDRRPEI